MSPRRRLIPSLTLLPAIFLASCKSPSDACDNPAVCAPVPATVTVAPGAVELAIGATQSLTASVLDQNGGTISGAAVTWDTNAPAVASVSTGGIVTGQGAGTATITATSGSASGTATVNVTDPCAPAGLLAIGDWENGELTTTSCVIFQEGEETYYADVWELEVAETSDIQIDLISEDFNTWLWLYTADGEYIADADDSHATGDTYYDLSAHIVETLDAGSYLVTAETWGPGEIGTYQLTVGPGLRCPEIDAIAIGESTTGAALDAGDCVYSPDGAPEMYVTDARMLRVPTEQSLTINLTSADFDAYLAIFDPSGNSLASDNDSGSGTDAQIVATFPAGWYVIEASTWNSSEVGAYTLSVN